MSDNSNPESTWGMTAEEKLRWEKKFNRDKAEVRAERAEPQSTTAGSDDSSNPESTWGMTPEAKLKYFKDHVENFDENNPIGRPTEVGLNDETLFERPRMTVDSGPVEYRADERPIEYQPIYLPQDNSEQDYTPAPPPTEDVPVTNQPTPGASDPLPEPSGESTTTETTEYVDTAEPIPEYTTAPAAEPTAEPTVDAQESTAAPKRTRKSTSGANDGTGVQEDIRVEKH